MERFQKYLSEDNGDVIALVKKNRKKNQKGNPYQSSSSYYEPGMASDGQSVESEGDGGE